jgi:transposase
VATARIEALRAIRVHKHPSDAALVELQALAATSIGTKDVVRQRGLVFEQTQLIAELLLMQEHVDAMDQEISVVIEHAREGRILTSIPGVGSIQAATLLATIGNIENFPTAATLKAYLGWAPRVSQSGTSLNSASLARSGMRTTKQMMFLVVATAIRMDCEWAKLYQRLVPLKCRYDELKRDYAGKKKVMGRIAGQMISLMFALLRP